MACYLSSSDHFNGNALVMLLDLGLGLRSRFVDSRRQIGFQEFDVALVRARSVGVFCNVRDRIKILREVLLVDRGSE